MSVNRNLLTVREVAELLCVPSRTIQRWVQEGIIPALRIGRTTRIPSIHIESLLGAIGAQQRP
jgi:excisionase family DNA binding protein